MKYPLTDEAKEGAKLIAKSWGEGIIKQSFYIDFLENRHDGTVTTMLDKPQQGLFYPPRAVWLELGEFKIIRVRPDMSPKYLARLEILLLQELRNAVATDFEVSEYFLTLNAVGNIIINSTTGNVQGMGINTGIANLTIEEVANTLESALGVDFLAQQQALKEAIDSLRTSLESNKQSKLGKVISELGNSLQHGANAYAVTQAIVAVGPALRPLLGL